MNKKTQNIVVAVLSMIILAGSLVYYFNYQIKTVRQDYEGKISGLSQQTQKNLQSLQDALGNKIDTLGANLSSQIGVVGVDLKSFKKQNEREINTLSNLIDQIEQQSSIKLNELKSELKDIQIRSADFSAIVNDVLQSVVSVKTNLGQGSGAIIDRKGYIVTNVHVINGASSISVVAYSGSTYNVNAIIGYDSNADIAVLKIDATNLKALGFDNSDNVKVGEKLLQQAILQDWLLQ